MDTDVVGAYADIGVTRLILLAPGESHEQQDELLEFVASTPRRLPDTGHRQQQIGRTFSRL